MSIWGKKKDDNKWFFARTGNCINTRYVGGWIMFKQKCIQITVNLTYFYGNLIKNK